jgi:hypothetical protein
MSQSDNNIEPPSHYVIPEGVAIPPRYKLPDLDTTTGSGMPNFLNLPFFYCRDPGTTVQMDAMSADLRNRLLAAYPISESDDDVQVNLKSTSYETCGKKYETCSVCMEDYANKDVVSVLDCGHIYHIECIKEWGDNYNPSCPICKTGIPTTPRQL